MLNKSVCNNCWIGRGYAGPIRNISWVCAKNYNIVYEKNNPPDWCPKKLEHAVAESLENKDG
jgi:hypothetical protein